MIDVQAAVFPPVPIVALFGYPGFLAGGRNALALSLNHLDLPQLVTTCSATNLFLGISFSSPGYLLSLRLA